MRLLNLPASVQSRVASGIISAGHARALLGLSNEADIDRLAKRIVAEGLSVRAVEEIIAATSPKSASKAKKKSSGTSPEVNEIAEQLGDHLDTRVKIKGGKTKGEISIEFSGYADLARIVKKIKG
jgi:ParB family chromosome partitioning protein